MRGDANKPGVSARLADVMDDVDTWEGELIESQDGTQGH